MKHEHHIIPKYEGGSDDPSNIVELTVTQHAMWHFAEWQRKGRWEDEKAWRGLAGIISHEEVLHQVQSESGRKGGRTIRDNKLGIYARSKEQHSRDSASGRVKGNWYNNGITQSRFFDPPEGWILGRLPGSMDWWTNGVENRRQLQCPGEGWVRGRSFVPHNKLLGD